jgi:hypothetical protein
MTTLTKFALGAMGQLRPRPSQGDAASTIELPAPDKRGGMPLMRALAARHSSRKFAPDALPLPMLSAIDSQEVDVYVALPAGAYRYDAKSHSLKLVAASDLRRITGYQDFVDEAPLDLVYVADHRRMRMIPVALRESYASASAGAIAQNVYLFAASSGLATVIRAWIDREAVAEALGLDHDQQVLLSQTVGYPKGKRRTDA